MKLNNVVFPAPFGPIKPMISPWPMDRLTSRTAVRPPKRLVTERTSSTRAGSVAAINSLVSLARRLQVCGHRGLGHASSQQERTGSLGHTEQTTWDQIDHRHQEQGVHDRFERTALVVWQKWKVPQNLDQHDK